MSKKFLFGIVAALLFTAGCDRSERLTKLEKQNAELQAKLTNRNQAADFDLQSKCAAAAKAYFNEEWSSNDPDTILLEYQNHYNKSSGKCFIVVEFHYKSKTFNKDGSWFGHIKLYDALEKSDYGELTESHEPRLEDRKMTEVLLTCQVYGQDCASSKEFLRRIKPYLND